MVRRLSIFCAPSAPCGLVSLLEILSMDLSSLRGFRRGANKLAMPTVDYRHFHGREERSTFPPEKITPSFGAPPSVRLDRFKEATTPGLSKGAMATALDGSMMIFMRSQTSRAAEMISFSVTRRMRSTWRRRIANVGGASEARKPSAIVSLESCDCSVPVVRER